MSLSESSKPENTSLARDVLYAGRYYLGSRKALLILAVVVAVAGLVLNWKWLVAIGLAPILLSALPCLVMCAFGVCMMQHSNKEQSARMDHASDQRVSIGENAMPHAACCGTQAPDAPTGDERLDKTAKPSRPDQKSPQALI